jgi:hypothetical protein
MVAAEELLPQAVLRQIGDKLYEKRKMAALEVEQIVKRLAAAGDTAKISSIIDKLISEFAFSPQANHRKVRWTSRWQAAGVAGVAADRWLQPQRQWFVSSTCTGI